VGGSGNRESEERNRIQKQGVANAKHEQKLTALKADAWMARTATTKTMRVRDMVKEKSFFCGTQKISLLGASLVLTYSKLEHARHKRQLSVTFCRHQVFALLSSVSTLCLGLAPCSYDPQNYLKFS